jgi:hypothetical protein
MPRRNFVWFMSLLVVLVLVAPGASWAQVNTVNLSGTVVDPQALAVKGAKLTIVNPGTGLQRTVTSDANGHYEIVGLPPDSYTLTVEAPGFATLTNTSLKLTLGTNPEYDPQLQLQSQGATVSVSAEPDLVDTTKTDVSTTINQIQIDNLPINGRNYINFSLLDSQVARDDTPSIGAAPTSGLNFGGQRARSNEVSVDGADAVDNSVNGVRSTVSQEAVQEFQVITSNYLPEYGRATGGVVNIVTKSGSNQLHGDLFGFLRDSAIQAQDPFSVVGTCNPETGCSTIPVKQSYTRFQGGATIGGPIKKDKTFYFGSYEISRRQETGFTNIGADDFGLQPFAYAPGAGVCGITQGLLTPQQAAFVGAAPTLLGAPYFCAAAASSLVALFGNTPGFPSNFFPSSGAPLPSTYQGLASTIGNFPTSDKGSLWSLRLDHIWNSKNSTFIRANVAPDTITGIEVNAQNQTLGQNSGNRTSDQQTRDFAIVGEHTTAIAANLFNQFLFQFARRGLHYGFSDLPGGDFPANNVAGYAYIGREPFTNEDRTELRYQWADNLTWTKGSHTMKFGADVNLLQLRSSKTEIFTLNYGGVYDFTALSASTLGFPGAAPGFTSLQAYGLGLPEFFYQGVGQTNRPFDNKALGLYAQDSWKVNRKLTINYGLRYDIEWTPSFTPATAINAAAEKAFNVEEGIPVDSNNFAPRIGVAWDPWGDGKTVIRAGFGLFYDHPALALAFLATTFDGAQSSLLEAAGGTPSNADLNNVANIGALNAASIFQGVLFSSNPNAVNPAVPPITGCSTNPAQPTLCYGVPPNPQIFNATFSNSLLNDQRFLTVQGYSPYGPGYPLPILPYTIPVERNFKYAYAEQANLTIEREITKDWKISAGYNYTHGVHLDRTININVTNPQLLVENAATAEALGLAAPGTDPLTISAPSNPAGTCTNSGTGSYSVIAPNILSAAFGTAGCAGAPIGFVSSPAVFNFFRPSGPNPSFSGLVPGGYSTLVALASTAGYPTSLPGHPGLQVPWSDVNPQTSSGNSLYNAFTLTVTKRFSHGVELLSGWTYSHTIDDSTDLSTLLNPQDNSFPNLERGNSDFDQRHRWITSAVFMSPYRNNDSSLWKKILADFNVAPVIELASGRPYNLLSGEDFNMDFSTATNRPSVLPAGTPVPPGFPAATTSPFIKGKEFILPTVCINSAGQSFGPLPTVPTPPYGCVGNLGRNAFTRPGFFQIDLRIQRTIPINERVNLLIIADGFNMLNRLNVSDVNTVCDPSLGSTLGGVSTCQAGQPTAAFDPRTFQFGLKVLF